MAARPTPEEARHNVIATGRAMVKLVEGAKVLLPGSRRLERVLLKTAIWRYQRRLRELVAALPTDISAEILAASDNIHGPVGEVSMN